MGILGQFQEDAVRAVAVDQAFAGVLPGLHRAEEFDAVRCQFGNHGVDVGDGKGQVAQADAVGPTQGRIGAGSTFELQQLDGDVGSGVVQGDEAPTRPGDAGKFRQEGTVEFGAQSFAAAEQVKEATACSRSLTTMLRWSMRSIMSGS